MEFQGFRVLIDRQAPLALSRIDGAEILTGVGKVRLQLDGAQVMSRRVVEQTLAQQYVAKVVVGHGAGGREPGRGAEMLFGIRVAPLVQPNAAEVAVRVLMIGVELQ